MGRLNEKRLLSKAPVLRLLKRLQMMTLIPYLMLPDLLKSLITTAAIEVCLSITK